MPNKDIPTQELLRTGLTLLDIQDENNCLQEYLLRYIHELEMFNAVFNLVKAENTQELIIKHILDSLAPWKIFAEKCDASTDRPYTIADIGSGAGLPGIPLACLFLIRNPDVQFTLIERMSKRCAFLENVCAVLRLTNLTILMIEAEKAPRNYFDIAVFRAFRPIDRQMIKTLQNRIRSTGFLAAYKGKHAAIQEELSLLGADKPTHTIFPVQVPFSDRERNIVIIPKTN